MNNKEYLTSKQVAARFQISEITLHRWVKEGSIKPTIHIPSAGVKLFTEEDITACTRRKDYTRGR